MSVLPQYPMVNHYFNKQKSAFYISAAHVKQGKNYLQVELSRIAPLRATFGYITAHHRNKARIEKSHVNDAVIIADKQASPLHRQIQTKHVQSRKRSLHEATARKGRKAPNRTQKRNNKNVFTLKGFNRWDTLPTPRSPRNFPQFWPLPLDISFISAIINS
jgi:hypothetical protein